MVKKILMCLAVASMVVAAHAIVCLPTTCKNIECSVTKENCNGLFRPNGGFCGCCPLCVTVIPEGGGCLLLSGVPQSTECIEGTRCINGTCIAQPLCSK